MSYPANRCHGLLVLNVAVVGVFGAPKHELILMCADDFDAEFEAWLVVVLADFAEDAAGDGVVVVACAESACDVYVTCPTDSGIIGWVLRACLDVV